MDSSPAWQPRASLGDFVKRVLVVLVIGTLVIALWQVIDLAVLLFGAILIAVGLRGLARWLAGLTGLAAAPWLAVLVLLFLAAFSAALWFFGTIVSSQVDELTRQVPQGMSMLVEKLQAHPYGRYVLAQVRGASTTGATGWAATLLAGAMRSITRALGYAGLTFFVAVYLAAQPERYRRLCLRLTPPNYRPRFIRLFDETAKILERWLLGQLTVMFTVGILSGIGLWLLGIQAAFALGLVGGLLTFVPYLGAVLAAVPATLVALTQSPLDALVVVGMYIGVHFVEGNFITPLVQAEATSMPPVLSLLSIVAAGILFGPSAVALAAPLALFLTVVVEVLYIEPCLHEPAALPGSPGPQDHQHGGI